MKHKKRIMTLLLLPCLLLSLSACGETSNTTGDAGTVAGSYSSTMHVPKGFKSHSDNAAQDSSIDSPADSLSDSSSISNESVSSSVPAMTIIMHTIESRETFVNANGETIPIAYMTYSTFVPTDETRDSFPDFSASMDDLSEDQRASAMSLLADATSFIEEGDDTSFLYSSNCSESTPEILRADDAILSIFFTRYSNYNGPHPFTEYYGYNYDVQSGEALSLSDVVTDMRSLPDKIFNNLEFLDPDYRFSDQENENMLNAIKDYVANNTICWAIDDNGINFYFDAYALQYYAFGPIFATLTYDDYPGLILEKYLPKGNKDNLSKRITSKEAEKELYGIEDLSDYMTDYEYEEQDFDEEMAHSATGIILVNNPDWAPYVSPDITDPLKKVPFKLEEISKEKYVFAETWAAENGITLPINIRTDPAYFDNVYDYYVNNSETGELSVKVSYLDTGTVIGTFDFGNYMNPPDRDSNNMFSEFTEPSILFAQADKDILYVAIGHNTYANAQPNNAYIVAIDMNTKDLLWRSDALIANARNFVITNDTIICGYGFTDEKDYLYILNKYTGKTLDKYAVKTAPEYIIFEPDTYTLRVLTYDTAYHYSIIDQ